MQWNHNSMHIAHALDLHFVISIALCLQCICIRFETIIPSSLNMEHRTWKHSIQMLFPFILCNFSRWNRMPVNFKFYSLQLKRSNEVHVFRKNYIFSKLYSISNGCWALSIALTVLLCGLGLNCIELKFEDMPSFALHIICMIQWNLTNPSSVEHQWSQNQIHIYHNK